MLKVSELNVWYGLTEVLHSVTFEVPDNKIIALLGGNGSGKTTVLNTLSGMVSPRAGDVMFCGESIGGKSSDTIVKAGLVQVPQGREVFASLSVRDNLELGGATRTKSENRSSLEEVYAHFPRLAEKRQYAAGSLSGGEQQQVAIARALMAKPKMLLMDEPSVGLSPIMVDSMVETIKTLHKVRNLTILIVEQNVGVAAAVAEQAFILKDGEIVHSAPATLLLDNSEVLSSYLGR